MSKLTNSKDRYIFSNIRTFKNFDIYINYSVILNLPILTSDSYSAI